MKLNLFGRSFAALIAGLMGACRWAAPIAAAGSWISPNITRPYRHGKTGIAAAKRRARKSRNRMRQHHGRA